MKVPKVSMSITVLKALEDKALAGHKKFPAAPAGGRRQRVVLEPRAIKASASSGWSRPAREEISAFGQTLK